jgi:hypothetical protein
MNYIQYSCFLGQHAREKMFLFKMFVHGNGSGCESVKHMQLGANLQTTWIMFDHVKRVEGWMTIACYVYDYFYCKVMTIVIFDM